jgi:L-threonylcarbamoyladenylate synthase
MAEIGKDISKAKKILENGGLVAIPTETVYGLAGNVFDTAAVARIFAVKNRPSFDPLIVHVASLEQARKYVQRLPTPAEKLAELFWPGPLTFLLPRNASIPDIVTAGLDTVGIRYPDQKLTNELLHQLNFPLAAPSANPFGYLSPTEPQHVDEQLGEKIEYILDGGVCRVGIESTIVGFEEGKTIIYRTGGLSIEKIEAVVGPIQIKDESISNPVAPGQLTSHYAPDKRLVLGDVSELLKKFGPYGVGILSFRRTFKEVDTGHQIILSVSGDLEEAAQNLFLALHQLDKMKIQIILAEEVPDTGIGRAINDRLRRAAASN